MKKIIALKWHELLLIVSLVLIHSYSHAQDKYDGTYGGSGYFGFRFTNYNFSKLNASFSANNLPIISENILGYGGGGHGYINRIIIGGEGYAFELVDKNNGSYITQVRGDVGFFNLGYLLINKDKWMLSPILGIGAQTMEIEITETTNESFSQILADPKNGTRLKNEQVLFDLGLQGNIFLTRSKFFSIGLKAGYQFSAIENKWTNTNGVIANGPATNADGAYTQLHFSFGGFNR